MTYRAMLVVGLVVSALCPMSWAGQCRYSAAELTRFELEKMNDGQFFRSRYESYWNCIKLSENIERDSRSNCRPDVKTTLNKALERRLGIDGTVSYMGLFPLPYHYDLEPGVGGHFVVTLRLHFTGALAKSADNLHHMQFKLNEAAELWSQASPGGIVSFRFRVVRKDEHPHFTLHLSQYPLRSPYNGVWGLRWNSHLMAHEIGHMLGLDDEYNQVRKTIGHILGKEQDWKTDERVKLNWFHCNLNNLMCSSSLSPMGEASVPNDSDYYLILRRRFCH